MKCTSGKSDTGSMRPLSSTRWRRSFALRSPRSRLVSRWACRRRPTRSRACWSPRWWLSLLRFARALNPMVSAPIEPDWIPPASDGRPSSPCWPPAVGRQPRLLAAAAVDEPVRQSFVCITSGGGGCGIFARNERVEKESQLMGRAISLVRFRVSELESPQCPM